MEAKKKMWAGWVERGGAGGGEGRGLVLLNVGIAAARVKSDAISVFSLYFTILSTDPRGGGLTQ